MIKYVRYIISYHYIMIRNINYNGLTERPHYASIVDYLENEHPKTYYPFDRTATILRHNEFFTRLDGASGLDLQDFETRLDKDKLREMLLKEHSRTAGESLPATRATAYMPML